MSKYRKLPVEVEAFRVERGALDNGPVPEWITAALDLSEDVVGSVRFCKSLAGFDFDLFTPHGSVSGYLGDWLVLDQFGHLWPYTDEDFHLVFEEVE